MQPHNVYETTQQLLIGLTRYFFHLLIFIFSFILATDFDDFGSTKSG